MSKVGIIFAMKEELDALKKYLELENEYEIFNLKFYEGKIGMGILYLFTCGLFGIGTLIDFIVLLFKPNPYYV